MRIRDSAALVTGAGRGLGRALAKELSARGARVVLVARSKDEVEEAAREAKGHALVYDVGDKGSIYPLAGAAAALVGPIDILIHNASTLGPVPLRPLLETDCELLEGALAVNVVGPFRLTKAIAGSMIVRKRGLIVGISSDAAVNAYPTWGAYGASKAAHDHLLRILGAELEGTGVKTFSIDPGEMDTRMHADAIPDADRATLARPEDVARRIAARIEET
jgi:NAD(P)-dependent dehydrogenase (short-subunit alcohol dehydrogenase family)